MRSPTLIILLLIPIFIIPSTFSLVYNYLRMSSLSGSARRGTVGYNYPQPARAGRRFPGCSVFPCCTGQGPCLLSKCVPLQPLGLF